jgi:Ca-activated chloride channel family protein
MKKIIILYFILFSNLLQAQSTLKPVVKTRILFVLDASGSMTNAWGNGNRFRASKSIISGLVDSLQKIPNLEMGLRVFGSMSPLNANDCKDTKLEAPIRANNAATIKTKLSNLKANGITPIAYALEQCANDFIYSGEGYRNIVILITDGIESCDGNACEISKKLQAKGIFLQPFIIGLGLTKEAALTFECVGRYDDAQDEIGFKKSLKSVMNTVLNSSTSQINLLDESGKATESNVAISMYDKNAGILRYNFIHTLNARGNPDTLQLDPVNVYDMIVHTVPPIYKNDIQVLPNKHSVINVNAAQGDLIIQTEGLSTYKELASIIKKSNEEEIIDKLEINQKRKYLTGSYDIEILTLPRISISNLKIKQSETTSIKIPAPGLLTILNTNAVPVYGSIYVERGQELEFVCEINGNSVTETITLQPGTYHLVYKNKGSKKTMSTRSERFQISSGSSYSIRF